MDAVLTCMVTDSLGPGSAADTLSKEVGAYLKLAGGVALRERTRALDLAVRRLALEPGAIVLLDPLVPHSYHATLLAAGLAPEYVDVSPSVPVIDAAAVEMQAEHASAVIASTHLGFVPELERIAATGLTVVEDISQGIGAHTGAQSVGSFGRFILLALEPAGIVTAGGGTLLLTNVKKERSALAKETEALAPEALLPDLNAALGVTQIKEIEKFVTRRAEIAGVYQRALARGKHRAPTQVGDAESVFYTFPVMVEGSTADVIAYAKSKLVECRPAFSGTVLDQYGLAPGSEHAAEESSARMEDSEQTYASEGYSGSQLLNTTDYPEARKAMLRCVAFPLYPSLTSKEVAAIERVIITLP